MPSCRGWSRHRRSSVCAVGSWPWGWKSTVLLTLSCKPTLSRQVCQVVMTASAACCGMTRTVSSMYAKARLAKSNSMDWRRREASRSRIACSITTEKAKALSGSPCCSPRALVMWRRCCPGTCTKPVASLDNHAREQEAKD
eukprot:645827-Amphidinium_carterae.3